MIDLLLDEITGDLKIINFDLALIENRDQIAQNLAIRLRFILGEWFLDNTAGIPYYEDILIKNPNQYRVESVLKEEIYNTEGILEILRFETDFDSKSRKFTVRIRCDTVSGQINLELDLL